MKKLQGFRTLIFNILTLTLAWLAQNFELNISQEHQLAITTTIITVGNIVLRFFTKTPVGKGLEHKPKIIEVNPIQPETTRKGQQK